MVASNLNTEKLPSLKRNSRPPLGNSFIIYISLLIEEFSSYRGSLSTSFWMKARKLAYVEERSQAARNPKSKERSQSRNTNRISVQTKTTSKPENERVTFSSEPGYTTTLTLAEDLVPQQSAYLLKII
ncbi:hypothetical protein ACFE04_019621 [Oxalis oulophora]